MAPSPRPAMDQWTSPPGPTVLLPPGPWPTPVGLQAEATPSPAKSIASIATATARRELSTAAVDDRIAFGAVNPETLSASLRALLGGTLRALYRHCLPVGHRAFAFGCLRRACPIDVGARRLRLDREPTATVGLDVLEGLVAHARHRTSLHRHALVRLACRRVCKRLEQPSQPNRPSTSGRMLACRELDRAAGENRAFPCGGR